LFSGISTKTAATRTALFDSSMHHTTRGAYTRPPRFKGLRGPTSKWMGGGRGKMEGGEEEEGR